jgi:hypothetical protein
VGQLTIANPLIGRALQPSKSNSSVRLTARQNAAARKGCIFASLSCAPPNQPAIGKLAAGFLFAEENGLQRCTTPNFYPREGAEYRHVIILNSQKRCIFSKNQCSSIVLFSFQISDSILRGQSWWRSHSYPLPLTYPF